MGEVVRLIPREVNGVKVEQRSSDGFINGTAMCIAHGKDIYEWFIKEQTFNNFKYLADDLGIKSNTEKFGDSAKSKLSATRYLEMFPGLLFVKRGSPLNGGGVWIHPDLATDLGSHCSPPFAIQVGRWVKEWFATGRNPIQVNSDQEFIAWQKRHDIRVYLKDYLRPELMDAVIKYALDHGVSPITLCSQVHDTMNIRIQGLKSKQITALNGLPLGDLIRDYFDASPLVTYAAINKLAKNAIEDSGIEPVKAVHDACDRFLGVNYQPEPVPVAENIHAQGLRLKQARKRRQSLLCRQLSLFDDFDAM